MLDQYGRTIDYIRISVTDRCNLRCIYCMPKEGVQQVPHMEILSYDEIIKISRICVSMGIQNIKLTGGEPLVRKGISGLLSNLKSIDGIKQVTLTTNGVLLKEQLNDLVLAGLDGVNISLDTRNEEMFEKITRKNNLSKVLEGIEEALHYSQLRVKINCVPLAGVNEDQWVLLAQMAKDQKIDVRFIEMMPIGLGKQYHGKTQDDIYRVLEQTYGTGKQMIGNFGNGPSVYVKFPGFCGNIGFISALSHKFCGTCNRVRLTAEGFLKPCLQYGTGVDLRTLIRSGAAEEEIKEIIERTIYCKPKSHHFEEAKEEADEQRNMSGIGG
ncbi:MAG: GTP 3',8-cyclase MoaA [Lachnospiraceae bacterium]